MWEVPSMVERSLLESNASVVVVVVLLLAEASH